MRQNRLRQKMSEQKMEACLIMSVPNVYYLSGFTGTNATLYITQDQSFLLTDFRYVTQAKQQTKGFEIIQVDGEIIDKVATLSAETGTVGIEEQHVSLADFRKIQAGMPECEMRDASGLLQELRQIKDEAEIEILRQAIDITDQAFSLILPKIQPGVTEQEIDLELEMSLRKMGASGRSFDYIVASGERSALPHGTASAKKLADGEFVTLDFGAKYKRYCSDFTRTVFIGKPSAKHREVYETVLEAQLAAIDGLKPGMMGKEVDAIAREVIRKAGYGDYFGHGLGHALGLDIHEAPRLNTKEDKVLEPGMVLTIEPGIYLPGWGGVRIEDVVIVTNFGVEVLTQTPKQCIIID